MKIDYDICVRLIGDIFKEDKNDVLSNNSNGFK